MDLNKAVRKNNKPLVKSISYGTGNTSVSHLVYYKDTCKINKISLFEAMCSTISYFCWYEDIPALIYQLKTDINTYPSICGKNDGMGFLYTLCANLFDNSVKYVTVQSLDNSVAFLREILATHEASYEEADNLINFYSE
jgi:hypothetical protein